MEPIKLSDIEIGGWFRFADPSDIPEHFTTQALKLFP